ncbi:hypothetical protein GCM10010922_12740 [Microbacterium sorbitolivorans]|uniref:Uncharacterized protein n=1 Tax=Microbacterium sorbitolivorans TaxID=1867410 RepID=A0A367XXC4_9MICO|nr:hypothetical protein [Microbacterium sorbitolivorans]RCK58263.1 hypothetical protein DTO57_11275 [Microbacterium sorbitolivorans]GGF38830.1 hypothetical protein GCM10010922_12740 [Microbacterium sorbitolivorans]
MTWIREQVREIALGEWSLELRDDDLAQIRFRGHEVLRSVRAVVRDRDWNTAVWTVESVADDSIALSSTSFDNQFDGSLSLVADDSSLRISFEVDAEREFWTNRTGLVVLHPAALSGAPLTITHTSGLVSRTHFPTDISPHQPAFDIRALEAEGVTVAFEGDAFEMEDQRNWTDASFKTYSRALADPFPYLFDGPVRQSVTISVSSELAETLTIGRDSDDSGEMGPISSDRQNLTLTEAGPVRFSVGASTAPGEGPTDPIGHDTLVEVDLDWDGWPAVIERAAASGLPLDVRLVLPLEDPDPRVREAVAALAELPVARIAAIQPPTHPAEHMSDDAAVRILRAALGDRDVPVIGGTRSHFTELNRGQHLVPEGLDGIAFSTTPMFHTLETLQLEQAIGMQRLVAEQAVRIADGAPVHVGPVTLRAHLNNVATTSPERPGVADLSEGYGPELLNADDDRQTAPELAAWTIASAAALAVPGVSTVSFFEGWGPRGIRAADGSEYPVADAIRALAALAGPLATAHDGSVWAIASENTLLVANLGDASRALSVAEGEVDVPAKGWVSVDR